LGNLLLNNFSYEEFHTLFICLQDTEMSGRNRQKQFNHRRTQKNTGKKQDANLYLSVFVRAFKTIF